MLASAVLVAGLLVGAGAYRHSNAVHIDAAMLGKRSMAVIPFVDLSVPPAPHLAEGMTQEIVTDIGRLPDALVIVGGPRADRPASPAVDVRLVGRELDVRHVLTGSVRREGDRITAHVQMTRTDTGAVLWSERFEYARVDGAIRDISQHVAGSLEIKLGQAANDSARDGVGSGEAMDLWMRGDYLMRHLSTHAELLEARRHLEAALVLDPQSLHAMSALAGTYVNEVIFRWSPDRRVALAKARSLAERALAIEPDHAVALYALGNAHLFDSNFDAARALFEKALRVNPNSPSTNRNMAALLYYTAQFEELKPYIAAALRLGPSDGRNVGRSHSILGFALMVQGRHEEAYAELRQSVVAEPSLTGARYGLVAAAALTGRREEAHRLAPRRCGRAPT